MFAIPDSVRIGVLVLVLLTLVPEAGLVVTPPERRGYCWSQVKRSSWWVGVSAKAASCASLVVWRAARWWRRGGGSMLGGSCHGSASRCCSQSYAGWVRAGGEGETRGWPLGKVHARIKKRFTRRRKPTGPPLKSEVHKSKGLCLMLHCGWGWERLSRAFLCGLYCLGNYRGWLHVKWPSLCGGHAFHTNGTILLWWVVENIGFHAVSPLGSRT